MKSDRHVSGSDALEMVLDHCSSNDIFGEKNIDHYNHYILAFSFYLSAGDDAYHYHTDFLAQKHSDFRVFLHKAKEKQDRLKEFIAKFKQCEKIVQWVKTNPTQVGEVCISIDDFYQGNLAGDISPYKEMSIEGAQWEKNIVTVHFRKRTASFFYPVSDKDLERAAEIFLPLVTDGSEGEEAK